MTTPRLTRDHFPIIPADWSAEQALATFELLNDPHGADLEALRAGYPGAHPTTTMLRSKRLRRPRSRSSAVLKFNAANYKGPQPAPF